MSEIELSDKDKEGFMPSKGLLDEEMDENNDPFQVNNSFKPTKGLLDEDENENENDSGGLRLKETLNTSFKPSKGLLDEDTDVDFTNQDPNPITSVSTSSNMSNKPSNGLLGESNDFFNQIESTRMSSDVSFKPTSGLLDEDEDTTSTRRNYAPVTSIPMTRIQGTTSDGKVLSFGRRKKLQSLAHVR